MQTRPREHALANRHVVHIPEDYANIWIDLVHPQGVTVQRNGNPIGGTAEPIGNTGWVHRRVTAPAPGAHVLTASTAFGGIVYGLNCGGSFAYALPGRSTP